MREKKIGFIGRGDCYREIMNKAKKAAKSEDPVLIEGETGVGKNLLAEIIHRLSRRKGKFITVHCPSIPEDLFEAELFGYRKGAFTGAIIGKQGLVEEAEKGTLFLDEITESSLQIQAKLLRFIETMRFRRIGDTEERKANVKIIAATNKNLDELIESGGFRSDLFYRLAVFRILIPPLRERPEDLLELINYFESKFLKKGKLSEEAKLFLMKYHWPGNVRELMNFFKNLSLEAPSEIHIEVIIKHLKGNFSSHLKRKKIKINFWKEIWYPFMRRDLKRSEVKSIIEEAYELSGHKLREAAKILGIEEKDYKKFIVYLHRYKLHPKKW